MSNASKKPKLSQPSAETMPLFETFEHRTIVLAKPPFALNKVCLALTLQAKNLYNTCIYAINQVYTANERVDATDPSLGWRLKPELFDSQHLSLARFNVAIERVNAARQEKYDILQSWAHESEEAAEAAFKAELKLLPLFGPTVASVTKSLLALTVLDNLMRNWPNEEGVAVYSRLPAKAAQLVLHRVRNGYSGFFEALKRFHGGGSAMTGRPQAPDYLAQKSNFVLELPLTQIGDCLIGLSSRDIPVDFEESISLTEDELFAWNNYRIGDAVKNACQRRGFSDKAVPQHLRIVPTGNTVKFEVVVRVPSVMPEDSLLARLTKSLGATLTDAKHKRNDVLVAAIAEDLTLRAMGVDFGVRNTAALAFNTGDRSIVVGAGRLEAHLKVFDDKLDAMASRLTTPELRELQARKTALQKLEPPQKLPRADETTLRKGLKALYAVPEFKVLRQQRERWLADYVHKLSRGVVEVCRERHIEVLVLGKNTGWKDGMNMGRVQNRRFGNVPIARLIEQIRYKAESLGMVVVTTEESYTSKSSFANNEELKVYSKEGREDKKKSKDPVAAPGAPESSLPCGKAALTPVDAQASTPPRPKVKRTKRQGRRLKEDRNTFLSYHQTGRWARVHADVNGAFNMLRKVFKGFKCHEHLSSKHTVMRISPRLGLTKIKSLG